MRIIAGKYRGRKLFDSSKLKSLRPTTDNNRENVFNILESSKKLVEIGFSLNDAEVLDVFCGTGSFSFEALSRGAKLAMMIDNNSLHLGVAKNNAILLGEKNVQFLQIDVLKPIPRSYNQSHNLIFIDPPYSRNIVQHSLKNIDRSSMIRKNALIVIERSKFEEFDFLKENFQLIDQRQYGRTVFDFLLKT